MKVIKKIILYVGFAILALIMALLIMPFVFKGKLLSLLKENINKNIHAHVAFKDADLSFIKSFPNVQISIDSLVVTGEDMFSDITLYQAKQTMIDINLASLFGQNVIPEINKILLIEPVIHIVVLQDSTTNYQIGKDTSRVDKPYQLTLDEYSLKDATISYQDNLKNLYLVMEGVQHSGKGDFTQDIFDLGTNTDVARLMVKYNGSQYLNKVHAKLIADININFPANKYTLKNNTATINELDFTGEGFVQLSNEEVLTDVSFKTSSESFKSFLSLVPNAFTTDFASVQTKGKASISGKIKGVYNSLKKEFPAFNVQISVTEGFFKYPGLKQSIRDIFAEIKIKANQPDYKDMSVDIPTFRIKLGNDPIEGKLLVNNATGNQRLEGFLHGKVNVKDFAESFPMPDTEQMEGVIDCQLDFKANMNDVNLRNYNAIQFEGNVRGNGIKYKSKGKPSITIDKAYAEASPKSILFSGVGMHLGHSDLNVKAEISNPLAYFSTNQNMTVNIVGTADYFDLNEWLAPNQDQPNQGEVAPVTVDETLIKNTNIHLNVNAKKVSYANYELKNIDLEGGLAANAINLEKIAGTIDDSDFNFSGHVINAYEYLFNNGILDGKIEFKSNKLDLNKFMVLSPSDKTSNQPVQVIPVPERMRMIIKTTIKELVYTNMNLKDCTGDLEINNKELTLRNLKTNTLGGKIAMEGLYNTVDITKPDFSVKIDLSKIKFSEAISKIETFKKLAPIAAYIDGFFNTTLVMKGKLGEQMTPDLTTLDASGFIETLSGNLKGFNPFVALADKLGLSVLKEVNLNNTKNWFDIVQGTIELKEFRHNVKGVDVSISGKHGFGKDMDYNFDLIIPRELLHKNKIGSSVDSGIALLEKEAAKLGVNINQGPNFYVHIKMTGDLKHPVFKISPKTSAGQNTGDVVKDKVNESVKIIKDTIKSTIIKKEAQLKDTITKRVNEELEKAKTKATTAANTVIDSIKSKAKEVVINKLDTLSKGVISDSLKQKIKEAAETKTKGEVDKIKDKLKDFNPFKKKKKE